MPPTNSPRPDPVIPDHEVLRKIGGGSYGEVWMARGVTGALRAVKVVYREDFDDVRSFEREFEGILKFEPISRDHPGLVNILHVGRSADSAFYYYVMELGDDVVSGRDINPVEYEARTLRSDAKRAPGRRLETEHCIDCALRLAEALRHLHDNDLAHRDVKPANVIFVNGRAKLADIGLVAARGQRTFVGTEGFVPPEGPGSAQADVYSLGKVMYEIATGKDRLDFPELPDEIPPAPERKRWLALNQIICDICEPQLSKRVISSAGELADALKRLQLGKRLKRRRSPFGAFTGTLLALLVTVVGAYQFLKKKPGVQQAVTNVWQTATAPDPGPPVQPPPVPTTVAVKISSQPSGADIYSPDGKTFIGTTTFTLSAPIGQKLSFWLRKVGYQDLYHEQLITDKPELIIKDLKFYSPPVPKQKWIDQLAQRYVPISRPADPANKTGDGDGTVEYHQTVSPVESAAWLNYKVALNRPDDVAELMDVDGLPGTKGKRNIVLTTEEEAKGFCNWMTSEGIAQGYLSDQHEVLPVMEKDFNDPGMSERARTTGMRPFLCQVRTLPPATLEIETDPAGAEVWLGGAEDNLGAQGRTQSGGTLKVSDLKPGETTIMVSLEGYKPQTRKVTLERGKVQKEVFKLKANNSVKMDQQWKNSLGMVFIPVDTELMACIWETRVRDYRRFVKETNRVEHRPPDFPQYGDDHPVVFVSRNDAEDFCKWLTEVEQKQERLTKQQVYRLPKDIEWSRMAGLKNESPTATPQERDLLATRTFIWGTGAWPPPEGAGNLADATAAEGAIPSNRTIKDYNDHYRNTAPVQKFAPFNGLYDLCGNVNEWVSDDYNPGSNPVGVLRGGAWNTYQEQNLWIGARTVLKADFSEDDSNGFRVMLAKVPAPEDKTPDEYNPPLPDHG